MSAADTHRPIAPAPLLPDRLRLGPVELIISDRDRSVAFYQDVIGLRPHRLDDDGTAHLGAGGEDVLIVRERVAARDPGRRAGLYHVALLYPTRHELARAALRLAASGTPIQGASDHGTHEAIYLADPDGIGLELAADRPRDQWPPPSGYAHGPAPLDTDALFALVADEQLRTTVADGLIVGHVHLHVSDLAAALHFYRDVLGFELQVAMPTAGFVSAGGYHHHVGFNTWRGAGIPPVDPDALGMDHFTVVLGDSAAHDALVTRLRDAELATRSDGDAIVVADPSGNMLLIRP